MRVTRLDQLAPRPVSWLWPGRLPRGKLAMLDGDPGMGKSLLTLDLCARLTQGRPFPDDAPAPGPANVLLLNAEDSPDDTLIPRLRSLGADLQRVYFAEPDEETGRGMLGLPRDLDALEAALERSQAQLAVLDPIAAFLDGSILSSNDQSVRRALTPLVGLARRRNCAIQFVRHLNKGGGSRALYRGGGSIGLLATCRSGWLVGPDPYEPDRRVLAQTKRNLAGLQPSLAFSIGAGEAGQPTLVWHGPSPLTADQLLGGRPALPESGRARAHAREVLRQFLDERPRTFPEVEAMASEQGLSERTLRRAKADLTVRSCRVYLEGRRITYWLLAHQTLPEHIPTGAIESDPEALLHDILDPPEEEA
jgi:hypothetical protein